jgi:two-component system LytT family response regulator
VAGPTEEDIMSERIRALVVDDEAPARLRLQRLLDREPDIDLVGVCCCGLEATETAQSERPDLLFLDVRMPPDDGFAVLDALGDDAPPAVVFVTASDEYAVRAFEADAIDYLHKPFSAERFGAALGRVRTRLREHAAGRHRDRLLSLLDDHADDRAPRDYERLVIKTGSQLVFLDPNDVDWVEAEGVYVRLQVGATSYLLRESLRNVEQRLDPRRFLRIHRSTILNLDRAKKIVPHFNGGAVVILRDGRQLKMSRSYRDRVSATLG